MRYCIYALLLILSGCASSYKPLRPNATYYPTTNTESGLEFSYKLGVLRENGNKKYAKREDRKAIRLASVKIVNTSDRSYTVGSNLKFYSGNSELILIDPATLHRELKQGVPIYLLYLLMTPIQFYSTKHSYRSCIRAWISHWKHGWCRWSKSKFLEGAKHLQSH
jgi:hypothetical protein